MEAVAARAAANPVLAARAKAFATLATAKTRAELLEGGSVAAGQAIVANHLNANCLACHSVDQKLVGPAYKDVAAKYAGQKDAVDKLAAKIIKGGSGVWGPVPMPANAQVNDAEAKKLAAWVLTQK
mgnify:CR=1 FL=1